VLSVSENLQTDPTRWRSETSEPPDPRDTFTFWTPSPESDHAVEMLERLPGLARAIEVWERDLCAGEEEDIRHDGRSLLQIHSSSALDSLDGDDPLWNGPDPLDDWVNDRDDWP
jgi:hypothetical protein